MVAVKSIRPGSNYFTRTFAAEIMTANPRSIGADASVADATAFLALQGFTAAPVIDDAGRPIGVISQSDLIVHAREKLLAKPHGFYQDEDLTAAADTAPADSYRLAGDSTRVRDVMTPAVFSCTPETSVKSLVEQMVSLKVHRLFVVDNAGILIGVVSALDVLRGILRYGAERA
jgi:CBS-domain-containing membrane protein